MMLRVRQVGYPACVLGSLFLLCAQNTCASNWDKSSILTLKEKAIAGDKVLDPGRYVIRLLDSDSDRHIVQITQQSTGRVEATILATPKYRSSETAKPDVEFWETPQGVPRAIRAWFYPGDVYGQEFAYPKGLISELSAKAAPPAAPSPSTQALAFVSVQKPARTTQVAARVAQPSAEQEPSWATASGDTDPSAKTVSSSKRKQTIWDALRGLPLTATLAPLVALIAVISLALFLATYIKRRQGRVTSVSTVQSVPQFRRDQ